MCTKKKIDVGGITVEKRNTDYLTNDEYGYSIPLEYYVDEKYVAYIFPPGEYEIDKWFVYDKFFELPVNI
jgi:hypothetical protein